MNETILLQAPLNPLSLGQVSYNVLRELYKRPGVDVGYFPIGNIDLSVYEPSQEFIDKLNQSIANAYKFLGAPSIKIWHLLNGGETRIGNGHSTLFTFHETSETTEEERAVINTHDRVFVSSNYTKGVFNAPNTHFSPLGFDEDFSVAANPKKLDGKTHWGLVGKFEKRKHTAKTIALWAKKFGNSPKHHLTCCVFNPFLQEGDLRKAIHEALEGKPYNNIQFLPFLRTNRDMNDFINSIDIDLSGLSGAEGWGLPAFNATALGKWSIVLNATAHKDWATAANSILVEPSGQEALEDGIFFRKGANSSQGSYFVWEDDAVAAAMDHAASGAGRINSNGLLLQGMKYKNVVDNILHG